MAADGETTLRPTWTDPTDCPFCGECIPDPGVGFVEHIDEEPECEAAFETWRERFGDDIRAGWSG